MKTKIKMKMLYYFFTFKHHRLHCIAVFGFLSLLYFVIYKSDVAKRNPYPLIIWWTPIIFDYWEERQCGIYKCILTTNRSEWSSQQNKAFLFYGSDFNWSDLPIPRKPNHLWALLHEESPKNVPIFQYESALQHFNLTATPSRYSNFPLTTQYLESLEQLTSRKYLIPVGRKNRLRKKEKLAPIVFIQSICDTISGRDEYVKELMKYIEIDSLGECLNNGELPESLRKDYLRTIDSDEFYAYLARYKFTLAYENGVCNDYITEKLWRPLTVGSIPIYFGAPTVEDWLPNNKSAILIKNFHSPQHLAEYIKFLDSNDLEYNKFLDHKYSQLNSITNRNLRTEIIGRIYSKSKMFENFECFVCESLYNSPENVQANIKHYDCGQGKLEFPEMSSKIDLLMKSNWISILKQGECEAKVLNEFLQKHINFTKTDIDKRLFEYYSSETCLLS